jgi:predicted NAD-dependent protein-ADP-ribosyltransferase YbiA (DUF1768 family)
MEKWHQVPEFREELLANKSNYLLEETGDNYWGIGLTQGEAEDLHLKELPGLNWLGKLLMMLTRQQLGEPEESLVAVWNYDGVGIN